MNALGFSIARMTVRITCADITGLLQILNQTQIQLYHVKLVDPITAEVEIDGGQFKVLQKTAERKGASIEILTREGLLWNLRAMVRRPVVLLGLSFLLLLACWLPTKVLFIEVEGNSLIPTNLILEKAGECGITFGSNRRTVRSEKMKNRLLEAVPQLQWAGINTSGCKAVISVKERAQEQTVQSHNGVSSIVAARDGIIESCTVTRGNTLCKVGQAVKAGETLISGYTDCGILIKADQAQGEIFARTIHDLSVLSPVNYLQKGEKTGTVKKYSLIIGKKRINFSKDSGILCTGCDKMYSQYYVTLPGGFQLPIALGIEIWSVCDSSSACMITEDVQSLAEDFAQTYVLKQMIAGQIRSRRISVRQAQDVFALDVQFTCTEMIGRVQNEEIIEHNGKDDRTDR